VVVDFHVHIAIKSQGMWTPGVWELIREYYPDKYEDIQKYEDDPCLFKEYLKSQGIDRCVLLAEDSNQTGLVPNDYIIEYSSECPEFYIPFLALNPNKTGSFEKDQERFVRSVSFCCEQLEWLAGRGFKGIKDYGSYNHIPYGSELMFPFYGKAAELGLPVLFHTGESRFDSQRSKAFSNPEGLGVLARNLPDLTIIIGHCGSGKYFEVAFELAREFPNVFLEFSGVPPAYVKTHFIDRGLDLNSIPDKLLFGSDYPALPNGPDGIRKNVEKYRELAENGVLTEESSSGLLGTNAVRILGLDSRQTG